ncbi:hypothetical protein BB560_007194, partial [Smittium megazygosporum]
RLQYGLSQIASTATVQPAYPAQQQAALIPTPNNSHQQNPKKSLGETHPRKLDSGNNKNGIPWDSVPNCIETSIEVEEVTKETHFSISRQPLDNWKHQREIPEQYRNCSWQNDRTGIQDIDREIFYVTFGDNQTFGNDNKLEGGVSKSIYIKGTRSTQRSQQTTESWKNNSKMLGLFHCKSSSNVCRLLPGHPMLRRLIELKNKALSQLKSWTWTITLSRPAIQNLEF